MPPNHERILHEMQWLRQMIVDAGADGDITIYPYYLNTTHGERLEWTIFACCGGIKHQISSSTWEGIIPALKEAIERSKTRRDHELQFLP